MTLGYPARVPSGLDATSRLADLALSLRLWRLEDPWPDAPTTRQGIDREEIITAVRTRPAPMMAASARLRALIDSGRYERERNRAPAPPRQSERPNGPTRTASQRG